MATFTSVTSGNWNDGATWGNSSPGSKGTDWPGNAGDVVNIGTTAGQSHEVTYNVSEANELGAITINATTGSGASKLIFSTGMTTLLSLGHVDIQVNQLGELRVGNSSTPIPAAYTATIQWNTTSDNAKGINLAAANSKLTICGDPAYYGSRELAVLTADSGGAQTIGNTGSTGVSVKITDPTATDHDYSTDWAVGQYVLIHKNPAAGYVSYTNDFCICEITGISYASSKTTLTVTVTHNPGTSASFYDNGYVLNVSRNIILKKYGITKELNQTVSNRPRVYVVSPGLLDNTYYTAKHCLFAGFYNAAERIHGGYFDDVVLANCGYALGSYHRGDCLNTIIYSHTSAVVPVATRLSGYLCNASVNLSHVYNVGNDLLEMFGVNQGLSFDIATRKYDDESIRVNVFGCNYGPLYVYSRYVLRDSKVSYDRFNNSKPCVYYGGLLDYDYMVIMRNTKIDTSKTFVGVNTPGSKIKVFCEHYNQALDDHRYFAAMGTAIKITANGSGSSPQVPYQRTGGNSTIIQIAMQNKADTYGNSFRPLDNTIWCIADVETTITYYVQTDFASLTDSLITLYAAYMGTVGSQALSYVTGTGANLGARDDAYDWGGYLSVTFTPEVTGYAKVYIVVQSYESGKYIWIDPLPSITGTTVKTHSVYWADGQSQLMVQDSAGGGLICHPGMRGGLNG